MFKRWPHGDLKKILKSLYGGGVESLKSALEIERLKVKLEKSNNERGPKDVAEEKQIQGYSDRRNGEQIRSSRLPYAKDDGDEWPD